MGTRMVWALRIRAGIPPKPGVFATFSLHGDPRNRRGERNSERTKGNWLRQGTPAAAESGSGWPRHATITCGTRSQCPLKAPSGAWGIS
jgi:hypothetical protein